jgi:hypothetical protein
MRCPLTSWRPGVRATTAHTEGNSNINWRGAAPVLFRRYLPRSGTHRGRSRSG